MVRIPAGAFWMGSSDALIEREIELCRRFSAHPESCTAMRLAHEQPLHRVHLAAYLIDVQEVTNAEYHACVTAGGCTAPDLARCLTFDFADLVGGVPEGHVLRASDHPVVCVDHMQAAAYCRWAGKRLSSEAEWEKAARGTTPRLFPWGDDWDPRRTNWGEPDGYGTLDGWVYTAPVGAFPGDASPYGVRDLGGNVWEWTADGYAADYYRQSPARDPPGPAESTTRVTRGGGFAALPIAFTTSHRAPQPATRAAVNIGFRCVRASPGPQDRGPL
jgi:formylglycine-generating enzyme required for sulfatase activity